MRRKKLKEDSFVQGVQHYTVKIWGCTCDSSAGSFITGNRGITARNACPKYAKQMECITRSPARCVKEKHSRISTLLYGLTKTLSTGHVRISTQWRQLCWRNWTSTWCWISHWIKCITAVMDFWESFSFIGSAEKAMHRTTHDDVAKFSCRLVRFQGSILPSSFSGTFQAHFQKRTKSFWDVVHTIKFYLKWKTKIFKVHTPFIPVLFHI